MALIGAHIVMIRKLLLQMLYNMLLIMNVTLKEKILKLRNVKLPELKVTRLGFTMVTKKKAL